MLFFQSNLGKFMRSLTYILPTTFLYLLIKSEYVNYANVPFWDEWDARMQLDTGNPNFGFNSFWAPHNEHRILLTKIVSYLNNQFLNGDSWPLLALNVLLGVVVILVFWRVTKICLNDYPIGVERVVNSIIALSILSNSQWENYLGALQSQEFFVILFPLLSFLFLQKFVETDRSYFLAICFLFSVLSSLSMANGLLVAYVSLLILILARQNALKVFFFGVATILTSYAYIYNLYSGSTSRPPSLSNATDLVLLIKYICMYLCGPFLQIFSNSTRFLSVGLLLLSCLVILKGYYDIWKKKDGKGATIGFVATATFIGITAIVTALGRFSYGVSQASASRYLTNSIVYWLAIFVLVVYFSKEKRGEPFYYKVLISVFLLLLPSQLLMSNQQLSPSFGRNSAALSLSLAIPDYEVLKNIYPDPQRLITLSKYARQNQRSFFSEDTFKYVTPESSISHTPSKACNYAVDSIVSLPNNWYRYTGWIFGKGTKSGFSQVLGIDDGNYVIGQGIVGGHRPDVAEIVSRRGLNSGFILYSRTKSIKTLVLNHDCSIELDLKSTT
jgi:hypothetical protein